MEKDEKIAEIRACIKDVEEQIEEMKEHLECLRVREQNLVETLSAD